METDYFAGKKVTVMGLGLLGRGVGDALYIAQAGAAEVIVTDLKSETELASSLAQLHGYSNITIHVGGHQHEDFVGRDLVVVAAGVPMDSPYLQTARQAAVPLMQSAALFAQLSKVPIIGITGTRGKSTVTHMIHHVLSVVTGEPVLLGGNVRGVSNLQLLHDVTEDSLAVMELDSWQLQGFGWIGISPQVAVFTSFMPDHLNYYLRGGKTHDEAMAAYFKDKAQIFLHQEGSGVLVTTPEVFAYTKKYLTDETITGEVILTDTSVLPDDMLLAMPGEHNRLNAALAYNALTALGLTEEDIFAGLASFGGVEGRLQYIGTHNGAKIFNDNNATTPQATVAGIQAVAEEGRRVLLIVGGNDKAVPVDILADTITTACDQVFLIPGTGTDMLLQALTERAYTGVVSTLGLSEAVPAALGCATPGHTILFSPAFSSFAQYNNEYERNDEFLAITQNILSHESTID